MAKVSMPGGQISSSDSTGSVCNKFISIGIISIVHIVWLYKHDVCGLFHLGDMSIEFE